MFAESLFACTLWLSNSAASPAAVRVSGWISFFTQGIQLRQISRKQPAGTKVMACHPLRSKCARSGGASPCRTGAGSDGKRTQVPSRDRSLRFYEAKDSTGPHKREGGVSSRPRPMGPSRKADPAKGMRRCCGSTSWRSDGEYGCWRKQRRS